MGCWPSAAYRSCRGRATAISSGGLTDAAAGGAADGAGFCLKNGIHRARAVRPQSHLHREGAAILNGNRLLTVFPRADRYREASSQPLGAPKYGGCLPRAGLRSSGRTMHRDQPLIKVRSQDPNSPEID